MPKVFVVATANLGLRRNCVRGADAVSLAAEEKLLERMEWVGVVFKRRVGVLVFTLLRVNCREQSLAEADRAARVKAQGERG